MISYRLIDLDRDYPTFCKWCKGHNAIPVPREILPRGWVAEAAGVEIAMSFMYLDPGKIAVIEWTTTNPQCAMSRDLVEAVKGLFVYLEETAKYYGCLAVISFVKPNSSEQRIVTHLGYATSTDDTGHRLYAKPLRNSENWKPPEGGVIKCPSH